MTKDPFRDPAPHPDVPHVGGSPRDQLLPSARLSWGYPSADYRLVLQDIGVHIQGLQGIPESVRAVRAFEIGQVALRAIDELLALALTRRELVAVSRVLDKAMRVFAENHPANYWNYCAQRFGRFVGPAYPYRFASPSEYAHTRSSMTDPHALDGLLWPDPGSPAAADARPFTTSRPLPPPYDATCIQPPGSPELSAMLARLAARFAAESGLTPHTARKYLDASIDLIPAWAVANSGMAIPTPLADAWRFLQRKTQFYAPWCAEFVGEPVQYSSLEHARQRHYAETQALLLESGLRLDPEVWIPEDDPRFSLAPFVPPCERPAIFEQIFGPHTQLAAPPSGRRFGRIENVERITTIDSSLPDLPAIRDVSMEHWQSKSLEGDSASDHLAFAVVADLFGLHEELGYPETMSIEYWRLCATVRAAVLAVASNMRQRGLVARAWMLSEREPQCTIVTIDSPLADELSLLQEFRSNIGVGRPVGVGGGSVTMHGANALSAACHHACIAAYSRRELPHHLDAALRMERWSSGVSGPDAASRSWRRFLHTLGAFSVMYPSVELLQACDVEHFGSLRAPGGRQFRYPCNPILTLAFDKETPSALPVIGGYVLTTLSADDGVSRSEAITEDLRQIGEHLRETEPVGRFVGPHLLALRTSAQS